jgi:hypothetical protein
MVITQREDTNDDNTSACEAGYNNGESLNINDSVTIPLLFRFTGSEIPPGGMLPMSP